MSLIDSFKESWAEDHGVDPYFPIHKVVCDRCRGNGKHVNPNIDSHGISADEFAELGEDFQEDYRNGVYDVRCEECNGDNVVDEVDESLLAPDVLKAWHDYCQAEYDYRAEIAAERRAGC